MGAARMSTELSSLSASNEASLEQLSIYTAWLQNEIEMAKARNQGQRSWKVIERVWHNLKYFFSLVLMIN